MSENHLRTIAVTLTMLDEAVEGFKRAAAGLAERGTMFEQRNDLSPSERRVLTEQAATLSSLVSEVRDALRLPLDRRSLRSGIWVRCAVLSDYLEELLPGRLARYGEVPDELAALMASRVDKMREHLASIADVVSGPPSEEDRG